MKKVALTGFGVFGEHAKNPTEIIVTRLHEEGKENAKVVPVSYHRSYEEARTLEGDILLMTGLAAGRKEISLEKCAYNTMKASIPDTDGVFYEGVPILEDGKDKEETTLKLEAILEMLQKEGIPSHISEDPGRYICNNIYYRALTDGRRPALFVHIPDPKDLEIETSEKAIRLLVSFLEHL
ncbi:MAG: pyroglutamyl-peptidase I [Spirochaetales bacterium]|nr:pyroglutamyl-peptidase I [Candidatus Physcosoma equi]